MLAAPTASFSIRRSLRQLPGVRSLVDYALRNKPVLTELEFAQFHAHGYLVIDPELPEEALDEAVRYVLARPEAKVSHHGTRVFNAWKECRPIRQIALTARVLRILRQLYGREPLPFQTINFPIGTEQRVHSDVIHFNCDPPTYMCGVWVALEDIDLDNGALVYYPGSHKLPVVTMEDFAPGPGTKYYEQYEDHIEGVARASGIPPAQAVLRKGQALIWAANLLHGGGTHHDKSRTRHSQVTHYYFEGCQYYMPLESYGGYRHLRFEEWIR
ncbi:phytanoyl-CoA dioxygenase family protein [Fimbriiglobus ruber]|uniref:Phytanoyl-CoA dioxygenase n=1 Tax=Fimbriiglobus ruber TaxID=1908690 RepID=A0A225E090_9BACT|nr:phytanoyl-CoA dioxygenase family protein [Fimbriiglobus ruber]OWK47160.1 Phytanoyl-CoA dioxygenase [Fimbriiglobus ruber]